MIKSLRLKWMSCCFPWKGSCLREDGVVMTAQEMRCLIIFSLTLLIKIQENLKLGMKQHACNDIRWDILPPSLVDMNHVSRSCILTEICEQSSCLACRQNSRRITVSRERRWEVVCECVLSWPKLSILFIPWQTTQGNYACLSGEKQQSYG